MEELEPLVAILRRVHDDEPGALETLVERMRPWLWSYVSRKMGPDLRLADTSEDIVQDVLLRIFEKGPRFLPERDDQLLSLVAAMAMNRLRDRYDWLEVRRGLGSGTSRVGGGSTPSSVVQKEEDADFLELGLALVDPEDALLIHERQWEQLDFEELGTRRGISEDAARMRFNRALRALGKIVRQLRLGELDALAPDMRPLD